MLAAVYAEAYGLEIVRARPFSHSGPGQLPIFLLSSLARQAAEGRRAGVSTLEIVTGNPDTRRDFTDVRDVVRAYRLLAQALVSGKPGAAGGVFNVSTVRSVSAGEQVALLAELLAPITVDHSVDPARVRATASSNGQVALEPDPVRLGDRVHRVRPGQGVGFALRPAHSDTPRQSRSRISASRIRGLIVPSGTPSRLATWE